MSLKSHWISETKILFWQKTNIYLWGLSSIFSLFFSWSLWNSSKRNVIHQIKKMWPYAENDITWPRIFVISLSLFCSLSTSPVLFFHTIRKNLTKCTFGPAICSTIADKVYFYQIFLFFNSIKNGKMLSHFYE